MSATKRTRTPAAGKPRRKTATAGTTPDRPAPERHPPTTAGPQPRAAAPTDAAALEHALTALAVDPETAHRVQQLPRDIGWLLVTAGAVGVVMPGVLGLPFLALGGLVLWPGNNQRAERWLAGHAPTLFKGSMRQISRFLDDLERRYPSNAKRR